MTKTDKRDKCVADTHTKNRSHKEVVIGIMTFVVAAVLVVLCVSQFRTLRSLENRAQSIEERQQRLIDEVKLTKLQRDNSTNSEANIKYGNGPDTSDDVIGNQQPKIRLPRTVSRRRRDRNNYSRPRRRFGTDKGKKNTRKGKKQVRGASFVVDTKSRYCNFHGPVLIPKPLGVDGKKSVQILCWINATDEEKSSWVTTKAGIITIQRKGYYHISPTLSLQLPGNTCVDKPGQVANVGFAVYKKGVYQKYGEEQQIIRCITGNRCDSREVWTCTSSRVVYLRPDDKLWVRVEGSLRHLASVWHNPAYTSINIVKV